ncbi:MAG: PLP-dependent aminotransferase family protein [Burkholderiaceae bacterium]|nr:PLP-dependent aminotransferase family protein [Burkholderiaceae bacterium]
MTNCSKTPPISKRARASTCPIIRKLLKLAVQNDIISFAGGLPSPQSFPIDRIEGAATTVLENSGTRALQYSSTEGEIALRKAIADYETQKGIPTVVDNIQIVSGSQQALDLLGLAFIDDDAPIAVESPTYLGALQAFNLYNPKYVSLPTDEYGLNPDLIDEKFRGIRFAYVMPTFQNPTGLTISEERRKKLAEKAREYDFWLIEDNPYGELWYDKEPAPSLRAYAPERTITLGTFSKILAPGLRLGFIIGPKDAMEPMTMLKQAVDLHTSTFSQLISAHCLENNLMTEHMPSVRALYRSQCQAMLSALQTHMPEGVTWSKPEGGMFIWVTLPKSINTDVLMEEAIERKVAFVPGSAFYAKDPEYHRLRLSFVTVPTDKIEKGIQDLAQLIKEKL